jgi:hypothetical protein
LALPNANSAENVTIFKIGSGTIILTGRANSQQGIHGFGDYATGDGMQIYHITKAEPVFSTTK